MINQINRLLITNKLRQASKVIRTKVLLMYLLIPLLAESWQLFKGSEKKVDFFPLLDFKHDIDWAVHDIAYQLILLIIAYIAYSWADQIRERRIIGLAILVFAALDTLFFFLNFKQWDYYWIVHVIVYTVELWGWKQYFKKQDNEYRNNSLTGTK